MLRVPSKWLFNFAQSAKRRVSVGVWMMKLPP
jgi:hypothetical protein